MPTEIIWGTPKIMPGSVRIGLDPSTFDMKTGVLYEFAYYIPDWWIIDDIVAGIIKWWKENIEGIDIIGMYREGNNLIMQGIRRPGGRIKLKELRVGEKIVPTAIITTSLAIILGLIVLAIFGVAFLIFGLRLALAGVGLIGGGILTIAFAAGVYRFLGLPLIFGGAYLILKQMGVV